MRPSFYASRSGFSLIELSMVLVVIGLVVGGIFAGRSLIQASETRGIISELSGYKTAIEAFRAKYRYLPGDMPNATDFWGTSSGCTTNVSDFTAATCNGNGDDWIRWRNDATYNYEMFSAWKHLANAELIDGSFHGGYSGSGSAFTVGTSVPKSRIVNAGYSLMYMWSTNEDASLLGSLFPGDYGHIIMFGTDAYTRMGTWAPAITTEAAWSIDTKLDDGKPGKGIIRTQIYNHTYGASLGSNYVCATTTDADTAEYDVDLAGIQCGLIFDLGF